MGAVYHGGGLAGCQLSLDFICNMRHVTPVVPFRVNLQPGIPVHEQVAFAARKAMLSGQLRPGDPFPSVRALSKAMKIHPNTGQKVVAQLTADGLLEVRPGIGTIVCQPPPASRAERGRLLGCDVEQLVVEAKRLGLTVDDLHAAVDEHWRKLQARSKEEA